MEYRKKIAELEFLKDKLDEEYSNLLYQFGEKVEGRTERSDPRFQYGHENKLSADIGEGPNQEEERVYGDMAVNPGGGDLRFQSERRMNKNSGKDRAFLCGDTLPQLSSQG